MGWSDHRTFGQGVADHPIPAVWGWPKPPPSLWGWSGHPERPKKKKGKMSFGFWGWLDHPQGPRGGFGHHLTVVGGGRSHPQALGGGPATPKIPNPFPPLFFFLVAGLPQKAWGGFGHPHTAGMGWPKPPLGQKWGGPATPFFGQGVALATSISLFFFLFFFFNFLLKKKPKMPKMTPFWATQHCFG
jgi:hypothetical protein